MGGVDIEEGRKKEWEEGEEGIGKERTRGKETRMFRRMKREVKERN